MPPLETTTPHVFSTKIYFFTDLQAFPTDPFFGMTQINGARATLPRSLSPSGCNSQVAHNDEIPQDELLFSWPRWNGPAMANQKKTKVMAF